MPLYLQAISNYAGSLSALHSNDLTRALSLRALLDENLSNISRERPSFPKGHAFYDNRVEMISIMSRVVGAALSIKEKDFDSALKNLKIAVGIQEEFQYTEPEHFYLPVRQCLGAALLMAFTDSKKRSGRVNERFLQGAEDAYRKDLHEHPNNPWSMRGMALALDSYENKTQFLAFESKIESKLYLRSHGEDFFNAAGTCCEIGHC